MVRQMENQFIITISRNKGSGGYEIADLISEKLGVSLYSKDIVDDMVLVGNMSYSVDDNDCITVPKRFKGKHAKLLKRSTEFCTFSYIRGRAVAGESFVVVGRCADYILSDLDCVTRVFITADKNWRAERIAAEKGISKAKAKGHIRRTDRRRKRFHNRYCDTRWGTEECYDYIIDSTGKSFDELADRIISFINT